MPDEPTKRCSRCGAIKPHEAFARSSHRKDGRQGRCKPCTREYQREWITRPGNRERMRRASAAAKVRYPEKRKARDTARNAVRAGTLVRPDHCERCGKPGQPHAHHDDYSKPLEVEWLCRGCHEAEHHDTEEALR